MVSCNRCILNNYNLNERLHIFTVIKFRVYQIYTHGLHSGI